RPVDRAGHRRQLPRRAAGGPVGRAGRGAVRGDAAAGAVGSAAGVVRRDGLPVSSPRMREARFLQQPMGLVIQDYAFFPDAHETIGLRAVKKSLPAFAGMTTGLLFLGRGSPFRSPTNAAPRATVHRSARSAPPPAESCPAAVPGR